MWHRLYPVLRQQDMALGSPWTSTYMGSDTISLSFTFILQKYDPLSERCTLAMLQREHKKKFAVTIFWVPIIEIVLQHTYHVVNFLCQHGQAVVLGGLHAAVRIFSKCHEHLTWQPLSKAAHPPQHAWVSSNQLQTEVPWGRSAAVCQGLQPTPGWPQIR